jgi:hypothetical protein
MNPISVLLAQIDVRDTLVSNMHKSTVSRSGLTLLFAALAIVTLLILIWATFFRKRPLDRDRRFSYSSANPASKENLSLSADRQGRRRRRRRRRPRNPTLAETRGLPPPREGYSEDSV